MNTRDKLWTRLDAYLEAHPGCARSVPAPRVQEPAVPLPPPRYEAGRCQECGCWGASGWQQWCWGCFAMFNDETQRMDSERRDQHLSVKDTQL